MSDYKITSGLPALPSADDKKFPFLVPIYNAINALAKQVSIVSGGVQYNQSELSQQAQTLGVLSQSQNRLFVKALETLAWGTMVTVVLDGGKLSARKADATDGTKPAHGCVATIQGITSGQFGEITVLSGHTLGITGTTVGQYYWLSTAGLVQPAPPAAAGTLVQGLGWGLGSAGFILQISSQIHTN
jgi:hypothetical protein